jgi:hypothetical protein
LGERWTTPLISFGDGPYFFRLHRELIHRAGSLLPLAGTPSAWAQLCIYDSAQALDHRMAHKANFRTNRDVMQTLQDMLYCKHPGVELYKHAFQIT